MQPVAEHRAGSSEVGVVVALDGDHALVETRRTSSCGGCAGSSACSSLSGPKGQRAVTIRALNLTKARVGEHVQVVLPEGVVFQAALRVYGFPVLALILGAAAGDALGGVYGASTANLVALLGGLTALIGGFLMARRWDRQAALDPRYTPVIRQTVPYQPLNGGEPAIGGIPVSAKSS